MDTMQKVDIAKLMHDLGMTPGGFAQELGLPRGQVSRLLVGEEEPDRLTSWALEGLRARYGGRALQLMRHVPKKPLAEELADDRWAGRTARLALPVLVEIAEKGKKITYGQLHDEVVKRGGQSEIGSRVKYAFPLGRIARAMERLELPVLTSIVVNEKTGMPSAGIDGFMVNRLDLDRAHAKALERDDPGVREQVVAQIWDDVFAYEHWRDVISSLGLTGDPTYDA